VLIRQNFTRVVLVRKFVYKLHQVSPVNNKMTKYGLAERQGRMATIMIIRVRTKAD